MFAEYAGFPGVIHTRLALDHVEGNEWVVVTPDADMYVEELSPANSDFSRFFHMPDGNLPPRIPRNQIYAFQPMTAQQYARFVSRGQAMAVAERDSRGLRAPPGPAAPAAGPAGADGAADEHVWVLAEMVSGHKLGEEVVVPPEAARDGDHALIHR